VSFVLANLSRAVFAGANLNGAYFSNAYTYRANFMGTDLSKVKGPTQAQVDAACLGDSTKLPDGVRTPARPSCE
jgi:uncharacterized protein YjbI with pentapeptide repeats